LLPVTADVRFAGMPDVLLEPSAVDADVTAIRPAFLVVSTTGDPSTIERARTLLEQAMPTSGPATGADLAGATTLVVDELARVVSLGVVMVLFVAGCSLAVAVAGGLLDRRRPFALLRMSGVPLGNLRSVLVLEAAAPLIAVSAASCLLGVAVSQLVLRLVALDDVPLPDPSLLVLFAGSIAGALAVVAAVLPILRPLTSLEETRFE
jgi:predicted lysophospholipase L1 biosynthesis ABC-type transport system permease subunit